MDKEGWILQQKAFYSSAEKQTKPELDHIDYKIFLKYIKKEDIVMELGCNEGLVLQWLKDNLSCYVRGFDVVPSSKPFVSERDLNTGLPYSMTKFDVIGCFATIEHLYNDWAILGNIKNHLKEGGYFIVSIPTAQNVSSNHIRYYPEIEWGRLMEMTGLELVEKIKHPDYPNQQHRIWVYKNV